MKKWSSQWTHFMQLRKEAWKKFRTSTGFEPVTSRYQCDALPTELWSHWRWEQVNFSGFFTHHFFIFISFLQFIYDLFHISLTIMSLLTIFIDFVSYLFNWLLQDATTPQTTPTLFRKGGRSKSCKTWPPANLANVSHQKILNMVLRKDIKIF